jgi:Mg-chelatase subunit ChlD
MSDEWKRHRPILPSSAPTPKALLGQQSTPRANAVEDLLRRAGALPSAGYAVILLDCSSSMSEGNKMRQARMGAFEFGQSAIDKGYDIGFVTFASDASTPLNCERDLGKLKAATERAVPNGTTNMASGLRRAGELLRNSNATRVIVLVTDGFADAPIEALEVAKGYHAAGIGIITVGTLDADANFLQQIASQAAFATVTSNADLQKHLGRQAAKLPLLQPPK